MTTSTLKVGDQFSVLGAQGIEKDLRRGASVGRVSVNPDSGSTGSVEHPSRGDARRLRLARREA